ncbi:hypothetical protein UlMin_032198 [Ulmus minor]
MASISSYSSSLFLTILLLSFFLNAFAHGTPPTTEPIQKHRVALVLPVINSFKEKIVDPKAMTRTWIGNDACNNFTGIECEIIPDSRLQVVAGVRLNDFSLVGRGGQLSLKGFLDSFPDIYYFYAHSNNFTGTIPKINTEILPYLSDLDLSNNKLSGPFPTEIISATYLRFLDLRFNKFYGAIPPELFNLDLEIILLNNNNFGQQLPSNVGSTPALLFSVANNKLTGPIPQSIGLATHLVELVFLNNQLTGCLPPGIGLLKNLTLFDARGNKLTGPIPNSFSYSGKMETFNVNSNSLFGTIPEALCKMKNLITLSVSNNYFTRVGPECRKLIPKGVLKIDQNCVSGLPNQKSKAVCDKFLSLPNKCPDVSFGNSKVMTVNLNKTNGPFNKLFVRKAYSNAMIINSKVVNLNHQRRVGSVATGFTAYDALDAHKSV